MKNQPLIQEVISSMESGVLVSPVVSYIWVAAMWIIQNYIWAYQSQGSDPRSWVEIQKRRLFTSVCLLLRPYLRSAAKCQFSAHTFLCGYGDCLMANRVSAMMAHKCYVPLFGNVDKNGELNGTRGFWSCFSCVRYLNLFPSVIINWCRRCFWHIVVPVSVSAALSRSFPSQ